MPTFKFSAKDASGKTVTGVLDASNQQDAVAAVRRRTLQPIDVRAAAGTSKPAPVRRGGRASAKKGEIELFTRQLATMIGAGIPLLECLEILEEQAESTGFKRSVRGVIEEIRGGSDLSASLSLYPKIFTPIYCSMVRAGEASGQLNEILLRLAEYLEASAKLKREIKAAMTYPVISLVLVLGITAFLMLVIVPKFKEIFDNLGVELPGITKSVMNTALFLKSNLLFVAGGFVASIVGFILFKRSKPGKRLWDRFILRVPVFGQLFRKVALSRFSRTFATLIKSGVPIVGALEIVADTSGNTVVANAVRNACESVKSGNTLSEPLAEEKVFPPMVVRMIGIGERSGALEQLLSKISEFYDQQVEAEVKSLTSLIEPLLIGVMGFIVGGIVMAVFLPILKLQEALTPK
jgi:type IV pilus assembly protein PilC